jgi:phosphoglycerate dehydrogenase-like enzyme
VKIAILDDYQGVATSMADWTTLPPGSQVDSFQEHIASQVRLAEVLEPYEIIVLMRDRTLFTRPLLQQLPRLRLLVSAGVRNAAIDVSAANDCGVTVSGTGYVASSTPELTWGLILALIRHIPEEDGSIRTGGWQHTVGADLAGRTLGIVGFGHIGRAVARVAQAFEMHVIAWSHNLTIEDAATGGATLVTKDELFSSSDAISIHVMLSERTIGLVSARELSQMKRTAVLVNTSRGPVVDQEALVEAVTSGHIRGAALDVFNEEPLPLDSPLRSLKNTVLTPHLGFVTEAFYRRVYEDAVEDIVAFLAGSPIRVLKPAPADAELPKWRWAKYEEEPVT